MRRGDLDGIDDGVGGAAAAVINNALDDGEGAGVRVPVGKWRARKCLVAGAIAEVDDKGGDGIAKRRWGRGVRESDDAIVAAAWRSSEFRDRGDDSDRFWSGCIPAAVQVDNGQGCIVRAGAP